MCSRGGGGLYYVPLGRRYPVKVAFPLNYSYHAQHVNRARRWHSDAKIYSHLFACLEMEVATSSFLQPPLYI